MILAVDLRVNVCCLSPFHAYNVMVATIYMYCKVLLFSICRVNIDYTVYVRCAQQNTPGDPGPPI
jgi:hypothetical protein